MCGIAGLVQTDSAPVSPETLHAMTDAIAHRGPDGEGQWIEGNVGLGHRRLAIIDLSAAAAQPMHASNGRFVISYNGEIYNYRELRIELQELGYRFRSDSDTEVALNALDAWGHKALLRFNGMFAFALWDRSSRQLLLARDRYGIKPLYYSQQGHRFAFASEQKAIFAIPQNAPLPRQSRAAGIFHVPEFLHRPDAPRGRPHTARGPLRRFRPCRRPTAAQSRALLGLHFCEPERAVDAREYTEELERLFHQAVTRQLVSDVELGSYLSGGMDSGAITSVAARSYPYLKTFTCGFDLSSASGIELSFDGARQGRGHVGDVSDLNTTKWC